MSGRKRQRDWSDSGGCQVSRRRNNSYFVAHEETQQVPAPCYESRQNVVDAGINARREKVDSWGESNNIRYANGQLETLCEKLQALFVFATVGTCVLMFYPDLLYAIKTQVVSSDEPLGLVASTVCIYLSAASFVGALCVWFLISSVLYSCMYY